MKDKKQMVDPKLEVLLKYAKGIIATLREPFLVLDKNLRVISANRVFYTTFEVREKNTIGQLLPDLGNGQWNIPKLLQLLKEIIPEKNVVKDYEVEYKFEQIGQRVMIINACQLRIPKQVVAIIAPGACEEELILLAIEDITKRRRLEAELRESEERYRRAFETSRDGLLLIHKTKGDILNSNESIKGLLGYSQKEFLKKKIWGIGVVKNIKGFKEMVSKLEKDGVIHYEDIPVKTKKGQSIKAEVFLVNKAKVLQCNIRDITDRRKLEEELRQVKEIQYRTLVENLPGKVFLKDSNSVFISCNENYVKDLGVRPEEVAGKTDYDFFPTYLAEKYRADDRRVMESGKIESLEEEYIVIGDYFKEVKKSIINTVKVPVRDENGKVIGLFGFFWDITERKQTEEELRNLHKRMEFILGATKTGLDIIDSDFNMVYVDSEWQKVYGNPAGKKCYKYFMGKNEKCPDCGVRKALETKNTVITEEILIKEGNRPVQVTSIPFQDKDGNWLVAEVNVDVTERKRTEDQLRMSDKKIRALFDQTFQFIGMMTLDGKLIEANKTAMQFAGANEADCIGKFFWDTPWWTHSKEMQDKLREAVTKAAAGESVFFEATHLAGDRSLHYIDFSLKPVKDQDGKVIFLVPEGRDITERKNMEAERGMILKWQQEVNALQQSLLVPAALEDKFKIITDGIVQIFNADFCRIWLIRPGDLCENGCIHAEVKEGDHVCRYRDKCLHLMASSGRYTHIDGKSHVRVPFDCYKIGRVASGKEHKFLTNDVVNDSRVHNHEWARELGLVSFAGYQLKVPGGETIGVLALFAKHPIAPAEDAALDNLSVTAAFIVQQSTAQEEIIQARAIKTASEIKSNFTGMVSHELRTPLAAIKEGVAVVLDKVTGDVNEEQVKYLSIVKNNVDRLDRLITAVLDFQKLESGKVEFNIEDSDMNELVKGVYNAMIVLFKKKGLSLELKLYDNLPQVKFDRDKIIQVLTNLVSNALKFTENGGVTISTSRGDNFIQVVVKDSGIGIKEENIEKLFQEFTQLQRKVGGTGLGLSICKKIIDVHKGKIWAESDFGKGASFCFVLPIKERRVCHGKKDTYR